MQVQVNTENHIEGGEQLTCQVEAVVEKALGRFSKPLSRTCSRFRLNSSGSARTWSRSTATATCTPAIWRS